MSFGLDKEEFYETFAELQDAEGSQRALEWAWSALDWTQQELRRERADVVAWLREPSEHPDPTRIITMRADEWARRVNADADFIESGGHRREEKG
jgi:hypothetical protein